jgi:acetylxylan esterase
VLGVSQTPSFQDTTPSGWTRTRYGGTGTQAPVEGIVVQGGGHNLPMAGMAAMAIAFFGLNTSTPPSSTTTTTGTPPPTGCRVTYTMNAWNTGFTTDLTIANTGNTPVNGWSLVFTLPGGQTITSGWNATYSPTSGQVTARNVSHNAVINPGTSVRDIGFQATHTGNTGKPASFTLNGSPCTIG